MVSVGALVSNVHVFCSVPTPGLVAISVNPVISTDTTTVSPDERLPRSVRSFPARVRV